MSFLSLIPSTEKICDKCKSYLSHRPIYEYLNEDSCTIRVCGRCTKPPGGQPVWFSDISEDTLFRCRNWHSCKKILKYWEVPKHEKNCSTSYSCPICSKETLYSLPFLNHIKEEHPQSILSQPIFQLILSAREMKHDLIYYNDDFIIRINVTLSIERNNFNLSLNTIAGSVADFHKASVELVIESKEPPKLIKKVLESNSNKEKYTNIRYSEIQKCRYIDCEFTINIAMEISFDFITQLNLGELLISKMVKREWSKVRLSGCRTFLMLSNKNIPSFCGFCNISFYGKKIYKCEKNKIHFICSACNEFDIEDKCGNMFVEATEEMRQLDDLLYTCRWNCGEKCSNSYLNKHEIECEAQPLRKCPTHGCTFFGTLRKIFQHYQHDHSFTNIKLYDYWQPTNQTVYTLENIKNGECWHYFASVVFVTISCERVEDVFKFTIKIPEKNNQKLGCRALIKYSGQKGKQVEDEFSIPSIVESVDIKVYLCLGDE